MMCEGENGNTIDLLFECVTPEENGVKIVVPVEYKDRHTFSSKIREQLSYFENVYFEVDGIDNEFSILREEDFQISDLITSGNMHICLDNVYYPIDFDKLGIKSIPIGIGLRFSLSDGLFPTPSRENLIYSGNTKQIILNKIKKVSEFLVNRYNENMTECEDIKEIFEYYKEFSKSITINNYKFSLDGILPYTDVKINKPKLKNVEKLDLKHLYNYRENLISEYKVTHRIYNYSISGIKHHGYSNYLKEQNFPMKNIYVYSEEIPFLKKEYLKTITKGECFLVKKIFSYKLFKRALGFESLVELLDLRRHPRKDWRKVIQEFQYIQNVYTSQFHNVDLIEPTTEWLESRKKQRVYNYTGRKPKVTGEVNCKFAKPLQRSNGDRNCKFEAGILKLEGLHKQPKLFVYSKHDDFLNLDKLFNTDAASWDYTKAKNKEILRLLTVSPQEHKKLEQLNIHNLISYEKFMEGDNKVYRRIVTAQLVRKLMSANSKLFENLDVIKPLSLSLYDKLIKLQEYKKENYYHMDSTVFGAMLQVAEDKNLFDHEIYSEYKEIEALLGKFKFLDILIGKFNKHGSDKLDLNIILIDLFKYHKFKLDLQHYSQPTSVVDNVVTDEEIDEILNA